MCMSSFCSHRHTHTHAIQHTITLALSHSLMQSYTPTHHHTPTSHPITLTTIVTSCFDDLTFLSLPSARILKGRKPKLPDCKSKHFDPMFITVQLAAARLTSYWAHSQVTIHGMGYTLGMRLTWSCIVCECESQFMKVSVPRKVFTKTHSILKLQVLYLLILVLQISVCLVYLSA